MATLSKDERQSLAQVLELEPDLTRKGTPALQPLSFYSSELKGTKQIAGLLDSVRKSGKLTDNETSRARYFNTLSNQGLVEGTAIAPKLTPAATHYLTPLSTGVDDEFWRTEGGNKVELEVIRVLAQKLRDGGAVSDNFKQVWFNAQTFFDNVPPKELDKILGDRDRLLFLFQINSVGWEIAQYFRLAPAERAAFEQAFRKAKPSADWSPATPIEVAAAKYKDAAQSIQVDVRFRISGFLNAYNTLRSELGANLPRLDRQAVLRAGSSGSAGTVNQNLKNSTAPLSQPHQLIVTGCPGSGKSYFVDKLLEAAQCRVFRTQFHPESSFFDFVGAYKPQPVYEAINPAALLEEGDGSSFSRGRPLIDYRFVPGPLMQGLSYALAHPDENVVVLIEEINRGNAAAILGDTLQLLDRTESGESIYSVMATPEIRSYFAQQGLAVNDIRLPGNLYLWATMNSADQGVFPLDTAFRRRWNYIYKGYAEPCLYKPEQSQILYGGSAYAWDDFREVLNQRLVELGVHEDKLIGPYFLTERQLAEPASVLEKLFLYLWDDVLRFRQDTLFAAKSFSRLGAIWANGAGAPLNLTLPPALSAPATADSSVQELTAGDVADAATTGTVGPTTTGPSK